MNDNTNLIALLESLATFDPYFQKNVGIFIKEVEHGEIPILAECELWIELNNSSIEREEHYFRFNLKGSYSNILINIKCIKNYSFEITLENFVNSLKKFNLATAVKVNLLGAMFLLGINIKKDIIVAYALFYLATLFDNQYNRASFNKFVLNQIMTEEQTEAGKLLAEQMLDQKNIFDTLNKHITNHCEINDNGSVVVAANNHFFVIYTDNPAKFRTNISDLITPSTLQDTPKRQYTKRATNIAAIIKEQKSTAAIIKEPKKSSNKEILNDIINGRYEEFCQAAFRIMSTAHVDSLSAFIDQNLAQLQLIAGDSLSFTLTDGTVLNRLATFRPSEDDFTLLCLFLAQPTIKTKKKTVPLPFTSADKWITNLALRYIKHCGVKPLNTESLKQP